jgi:hypothetical protein
MARRIVNDGQELIYQDLNDLQALSEQEIYDRVVFQMLQKVENAFFQDSFKAVFVDATNVSLNAGLGLQTDATVAATEPQKRPIFSATSQTVTVADPDGVNDRIDKIAVKVARVVTGTDTRKYKATIGGSVTSTVFNVKDDWSSDVVVVTGTPSGSPVAPATPAGYLAVATVLVHAVTGLGGQVDITDLRSLMPVGGATTVNTTGYQRLPAGASTSIASLFAAADALLKQGYLNYTDFDDLGADPAAPGASKVRVYLKGGVAFLKDSSAAVTPLGSGGGGGGGGEWHPNAIAPTEDTENGELVWIFSKADVGSQKLSLFVKVPQSYIAGRQILMFLGQYSPSASNTQLLSTVSSLIRKNLDAIGSTANQRTSTNSALTNTVANMYRQSTLDLTDATGKINGFSVSPGDLIRLDLVRGVDTDTDDIRFVPSATELKFS